MKLIIELLKEKMVMSILGELPCVKCASEVVMLTPPPPRLSLTQR